MIMESWRLLVSHLCVGNKAMAPNPNNLDSGNRIYELSVVGFEVGALEDRCMRDCL
jgi:hypothetical protein